MMKNCQGMLGLATLVEKLSVPPPLKVFVSTGVHWAKGNARLVAPARHNCPPCAPLWREGQRVVPDTGCR